MRDGGCRDLYVLATASLINDITIRNITYDEREYGKGILYETLVTLEVDQKFCFLWLENMVFIHRILNFSGDNVLKRTRIFVITETYSALVSSPNCRRYCGRKYV
jgi:hypothetical protein